MHLTRNTADLHFWYGAGSSPVMVSYNGKDYGYAYNLQGDVIALTDMENGFAEVVPYAYDSWGKPIGCTGAMAGTLGRENPFRYRGYVYDEETGLFSLPARFYNPDMGRFINADPVVGRVGELLSHNVFAYCYNNPVNLVDPTGFEPIDYSMAEKISRADLIRMNNGVTKSGKARTTPVAGEGSIYIPALDATLQATWTSIGKHHLDIRFPDEEDRKIIMAHFGFTMEHLGTLDDWAKAGAWDPVQAYLEFNGHIVSGSVNLALHSGSGKDAVLNVVSGNVCFYSFDSKTSAEVISPLIQKHRDEAMGAYATAKEKAKAKSKTGTYRPNMSYEVAF